MRSRTRGSRSTLKATSFTMMRSANSLPMRSSPGHATPFVCVSFYDWMGGFGKTSRRFWSRLRAGGVEVRCYNPPRLASPFGWLSRDHRTLLSVDGSVGFVTGLCVGRAWVGDPARGVPPWRDTGVDVRGPAVHPI